MQDAWRVYLDMALGLAEVPKKKAQQIAEELLARGGATAAQVQGLVTEAFSAGLANREALTKIVRFEVDRALGAVGLATAEEVTELNARVRDLETQLKQARARVQPGATPDPEAAHSVHAGRDDKPAPMPRPTTPRSASRTTAGESAATRAAAAAAAAGTAGAGSPGGVTATAGQAATRGTKAVAKKAVAKKAVAKKAVAKKSGGSAGTGGPAGATLPRRAAPVDKAAGRPDNGGTPLFTVDTEVPA